MGERWQARRATAIAVGLSALVGPPLLGLVAGALARRVPPVAGASVAVRGLVACLAALLVGGLAGAAGRRLLPLAALLRVSLLFPDQAPSRLRVARLSGSSRALTRRVRLEPEGFRDASGGLELIAALHAHDRRTRGHSERVMVLTEMLAGELHLDRGQRDRLCWAALLHDVGKLWVSADILNKPGELDADEWTVMRRHPELGARACRRIMPWLGEWGLGVVQHHEKFDGSGYPRGLSGAQISLAGRVVSVVDAFEVMTATRSYRKPIATRLAREELARCAGSHFDPAVVRSFLSISVPRLLWSLGPLSFLLHVPFLGQLQQTGAQLLTMPSTLAPALAAGVSSAVLVAGTPALPIPFPLSPPAAGSVQQPGAPASARPADPEGSGSPAGGRYGNGGTGKGSAAATATSGRTQPVPGATTGPAPGSVGSSATGTGPSGTGPTRTGPTGTGPTGSPTSSPARSRSTSSRPAGVVTGSPNSSHSENASRKGSSSTTRSKTSPSSHGVITHDVGATGARRGGSRS